MSTDGPIKVLVVDDHAVVREGIRHVLSDATVFDVVGEGASGPEAIALSDRLRPDVVILDISMPGGSGLHAVGELLERRSEVRVLMLSVHEDPEYVLEAVRAGAHGYLRKDSTPAELRDAIRSVHAGNGWFSPTVAQQIAGAIREGKDDSALKPPKATDVLTARELQILVQIAEGLTNKETGVKLGISVRTVEAHRDSLMRKLGVRTVAGLTRLVLEQGLV